MLRTPALLVASALTAAALLVSPSAQAVKVNQSFTVPADGTFTVVGHGFGHGRGMGQYGANGAAKKGLTHQQILAFYYPGTTLTTVSGALRVLITADTTRDTVVLPTKNLSFRNLATGKLYKLSAAKRINLWRLVPSSGKTVLQYRVAKTWHRVGKPLAGDGEFRAPGSRLTLVLPGGVKKAYRGWLRNVRPGAGSTDRDTVNVATLDDYVKGVVPAEMPASWSPEAVRGQAVAARSYAWWKRSTAKTPTYDICDTTACQVYGGVGSEATASNAAVDATKGQVLLYGGKPAFTEFSASNGGWIAAGSVPYQKAKADPYDDWAGNKVHDWSLAVDEAKLEKKYPAIGDLKSITVTSREGGSGEWGGRVLTLTLVGTKASKAITGGDFRTVLGLRSTWFSFTA